MSIATRHANPAHVMAGSRTFFVTSSIWDKRNLLQSDRAAGLFLRVLYGYREQNKFRLHAFVIMPDHFHVLITVGSENTIERVVQFIKGGFSFRAGKELGMRSPVWQKRFSEVRVTDAGGFLQIRTYIHNNPVLCQLVTDPQDYTYSLAHSGFELDPVPLGVTKSYFHMRSNARHEKASLRCWQSVASKPRSAAAKAESFSVTYGMPEGIP